MRFTHTRRFVAHFIAMTVAMVVGMMLLDPAWSGLAPGLSERPAVHTLVMAFDMTLGMAVLMWLQRHAWRQVLEMAVAMVAPFLLLLIPYQLGALSGDGLMTWGHVLMFAAMFGAMLFRLDHYTHAHGWRWRPAA